MGQRSEGHGLGRVGNVLELVSLLVQRAGRSHSENGHGFPVDQSLPAWEESLEYLEGLIELINTSLFIGPYQPGTCHVLSSVNKGLLIEREHC